MKNSLNYLSKFFLCLLVVCSFASCEDDEKSAPDPEPNPTVSGVFILNQGLENMGDASISFLDLSDDSNQSSLDITKGLLGDTGQDMIVYGSKLYVSVSGSNYIKVYDAYSKKDLQTINVKKEGQSPSMPRSLASYNGKIYATVMSGYVIRIDTTTYKIENWTTVGPNPEGIAATTVNGKGKLYVANSDGYNWENDCANGKSVSVIDVETFKESETRISVGTNPAVLHADSYGNVYVVCIGNYSDIPTSFVKIDAKTNQTQEITGFVPYNFTISGKYLYFYNSIYTSVDPISVGVYDVEKQEIITNDFINDDIALVSPYGIGVDPVTGEVYVGDYPEYGLPGELYIFNKEGKNKQNMQTGVGPCAFAFY